MGSLAGLWGHGDRTPRVALGNPSPLLLPRSSSREGVQNTLVSAPQLSTLL